ncbi:hypothetical protein LCGC14_3110500, partial [marine sediment metagenome]
MEKSEKIIWWVFTLIMVIIMIWIGHESFNTGYEKGNSTGYNQGLSNGNITGYNLGNNTGYKTGYNKGFEDKNTEVNKKCNIFLEQLKRIPKFKDQMDSSG